MHYDEIVSYEEWIKELDRYEEEMARKNGTCECCNEALLDDRKGKGLCLDCKYEMNSD